MIRLEIALLSSLLLSVSCATVIDSGEPTGGDGDGDEVKNEGSGGADDAAAGGAFIATGAGGTGSGNTGSGGSSSTSSGGASSSGSGGAPSGSGGGSTVEPGITLFFDDFENGSDAWTLGLDGWSLATDGSSVLSQTTLDSDVRLAVAGESSWTDQIVEARMKITSFPGSSTSYYAAVYARAQDADNCYFLAMQSNGEAKIKKRAGGSESSISGSGQIDVTTGVWYTVRLHAVGSVLTAYVDDQPVVTGSDPTFSSGMAGVGTRNGAAVFDDVLVTTPE